MVQRREDVGHDEYKTLKVTLLAFTDFFARHFVIYGWRERCSDDNRRNQCQIGNDCEKKTDTVPVWNCRAIHKRTIIINRAGIDGLCKHFHQPCVEKHECPHGKSQTRLGIARRVECRGFAGTNEKIETRHHNKGWCARAT